MQEKAAEHLARLSRHLRQEKRTRQGQEIEYQLALLHSRHQEWNKTLEITKRLLQEGAVSEQPETVHLRAEALARNGMSEQALDLLEKLPEDFPTTDRAQAQKAQILFNLGKDRAAGRELEPLVGSTRPEGWMLAAEIYQRNEQYEHSIPLIERALERLPESLQLWFWLGAAHERTGQPAAAEGAFRRVLSLNPEFAPALNYLGYMWVEKGENLEEAQQLVQRAVALEPNNGAYVDSLGWAYFQLQDYVEARDLLERAVRLMPDDAVVLEHLGDVYNALGQSQDARRVYERAVELNPDADGSLQDKIRSLADDI
jgi:tetratricopeptide (TPR) repeat protein